MTYLNVSLVSSGVSEKSRFVLLNISVCVYRLSYLRPFFFHHAWQVTLHLDCRGNILKHWQILHYVSVTVRLSISNDMYPCQHVDVQDQPIIKRTLKLNVSNRKVNFYHLLPSQLMLFSAERMLLFFFQQKLKQVDFF